jgi:Tfp pilus assembly protein PilN
MAAGYASGSRRLAQRRAELPELREAARVADSNRETILGLREDRDRLREQADILDSTNIRRYAALELLRAMSLYSPEEVVLLSFTMRQGQPLELRGTAPAAGMVVDFAEALGESPLVSQVEFDNMTRVQQAGARKAAPQVVRFTLNAHLWTEREPALERRSTSAWEQRR